MRLFPLPGTLGTPAGRQAVLDPPFSLAVSPISVLAIGEFTSLELAEADPWGVDPDLTTLLN